MANTATELKKKKYKKLIEDLSRINDEMKILDDKTRACKGVLEENIIIDDYFYKADNFNQIEKEIKSISKNLKSQIIPNLITELNQLD